MRRGVAPHLFASCVLYGATCAIFTGCVTLPAFESNAPADEIRRFYMEEVGDPMCSVAIVNGNGVTFGGDPHTIYRIASLTKLFVSEAFLRLADRGELDLDVSVRRCSKYPLADEYETVTLRDLMEHRSGMPMDFLNPWNPLAWHRALMCGLTGSHIYAEFDGRDGFGEECNSWRTRRFLAERKAQYSNVGFALLVTAVEDATGRSIVDILHKEVIVPLGLQDTTFVPDSSQAARMMRPCAGKLPWLVRRGRPVEAHVLGPALVGMGGLHSSAADCAKFFKCCGVRGNGGLRERKLPSGRIVDYRFGMIYGGESFVCIERNTGAILVILRNVTSWPAAEDFEMADRLFSSLCRKESPTSQDRERKWGTDGN